MRRAVITADIIKSSSFDKKSFQIVLNTLKQEFKSIETSLGPSAVSFDIYRGDSFQVVLFDASLALSIALRLKAALNKIQFSSTKSKAVNKTVDLRMSIGVGDIEYPMSIVAESDGEAYRYSGRSLDQYMKSTNRKTILKTSNDEVNGEFETSFKFLDSLIDKWSIASAEVVYYLLQGYKETQIANELGVSQAAINLRKKAAGWEEIQLLIKRYTHVIKNFK